jgi:hypothetical protein
MIDRTKGYANFGLDNPIRMRWVLRDIKNHRLKLSPLSAEDTKTLVAMGYVEMRDETPTITASGVTEMDVGAISRSRKTQTLRFQMLTEFRLFYWRVARGQELFTFLAS